jgi:hypothetical protein
MRQAILTSRRSGFLDQTDCQRGCRRQTSTSSTFSLWLRCKRLSSKVGPTQTGFVEHADSEGLPFPLRPVLALLVSDLRVWWQRRWQPEVQLVVPLGRLLCRVPWGLLFSLVVDVVDNSVPCRLRWRRLRWRLACRVWQLVSGLQLLQRLQFSGVPPAMHGLSRSASTLQESAIEISEKHWP